MNYLYWIDRHFYGYNFIFNWKQKNFHELYDKSKLAHLFLNSGASATMRLFLLDNSLFLIRFFRNFRCLSSSHSNHVFSTQDQGLTGTQGCRANPKHGAFQYSRLSDWLFGFFRSFGFCEFLDKFFQITIRIGSTLLPFRLAMAIAIEGYCHFSAKTPSIGVGRR